jgi:hypothetical protein
MRSAGLCHSLVPQIIMLPFKTGTVLAIIKEMPDEKAFVHASKL